MLWKYVIFEERKKQAEIDVDNIFWESWQIYIFFLHIGQHNTIQGVTSSTVTTTFSIGNVGVICDGVFQSQKKSNAAKVQGVGSTQASGGSGLARHFHGFGPFPKKI